MDHRGDRFDRVHDRVEQLREMMDHLQAQLVGEDEPIERRVRPPLRVVPRTVKTSRRLGERRR